MYSPPHLHHPRRAPRRTHIHTPSRPIRALYLKGDIRNKFDTSAYPRSALRTKRNLILDKPPDRISALALCCWFTAIPSTLTSHTLAQFPRISSPLLCLFVVVFFIISFPPLPLYNHHPHLFTFVFSLLSLVSLFSSPHR